MEEKIKGLIESLNTATEAYYKGHSLMSDRDWDDLFNQLKSLEEQTGIIFPNSPTQKIGYEVMSALKKVTHNHPLKSLESTKDINKIKEYLGDKDYLAMCKMDGLTCSLRYVDGKLVSAETRGDGFIGEDILHNAKVIPSIPKTIPIKEELILDGEIICTYKNFENFSHLYKNPRNFASGSIRLLDSKECEKRKLTFVVWDVIKGLDSYKGKTFNHLSEKLVILAAMVNVNIVPSIVCSKKTNLEEVIEDLKEQAQICSYPIDGLVFKFDDIAYGKTLGETAHHFKNAIAYKFYDETYESHLANIDWTMGRTGILTPVAIFDPIEIEGTIVSRASLHNLSVLKETLNKPYFAQPLEVYKANKIIPQIYSATKADLLDLDEFLYLDIPKYCPICGTPTTIEKNNGVELLKCNNPNCEGKEINKLEHFCSKKGLDIKGLSKATLEKLMEWGWVNSFIDVLTLERYKDEWVKKDGFGEKSVNKILNSIKQATSATTLEDFLSSLGIPLIGKNVAKDIASHVFTYEDFRQLIKENFDFSQWSGFAEMKATSLLNYDYSLADEIVGKNLLTFADNRNSIIGVPDTLPLKDITVVITGKLNYFKNRDYLKAEIEKYGGKVAETITNKTTYLINNDISSNSAKNQKAKSLGIKIISEEEFLKIFDFLENF